MTAPHRRLFPVLLVCLLAVACGSSSPKSPTAPESGGPSVEPPSTSGATISGLVSSSSSNASVVVAMGASGLSGVSVSVAGTSLAAKTDSMGHFGLSGVPPGLARLQFSGAGASGEVEIEDVGEHESIEIEVHPSGGGMELDSEEREGNGEAQLEGKIVSVNAGAHTFVVKDMTVSVPQGVSIAHGSTTLAFSDLIAGARVHVKGSKSGSTITATRIEVQQSGGPGPGNGNGNGGGGGDDNDDNDNDNGDDNDNGQEVEFTGTVAALGGGCPAITFTAGDHSVATTGATRFDTPCSQIHNGLKVEVKGKSTGNGAVKADRVKVED
jgi:uncharacterized protein DUF5666